MVGNKKRNVHKKETPHSCVQKATLYTHNIPFHYWKRKEGRKRNVDGWRGGWFVRAKAESYLPQGGGGKKGVAADWERRGLEKERIIYTGEGG